MSPLQKYGRRVLRRWPVIVVLALVGGLAAGLWSLTRPLTTWTATTALTTESKDRGPDQDAVLALGYVDYFNQDSYQQLLRPRLDTPGAVVLSAKTGATSPLFYIQATGTDEGAARTQASAATTAFVADVETSLRNQRDALVDDIQAKVDDYVVKLKNPTNTDADRRVVLEQISALQARVTDLQSDTSNQIKVLQPEPGMTDTARKPATAAALGGTGGAVLGFLVAFVLVVLERRIRDRDDLRARLGLDVLAEFGRERDTTARTRALASLVNRLDLAGTANDDVASASRRPFGSGRVVAVVAARRTARSSALVRDLGALLAARRTHSTMILADLRAPADPSLAGRAGLTTVLDRSTSLRAALTTTTGGRVLAPGEPPTGDASAAFEPRRVADVLQEACQAGDVVLIDVPPVLEAPEAELICALADDVIVVVERDRSTVEDVERALALLSGVQAHLVGVVLDAADDGVAPPPLLERFRPMRQGPPPSTNGVPATPAPSVPSPSTAPARAASASDDSPGGSESAAEVPEPAASAAPSPQAGAPSNVEQQAGLPA